MLLERAADQATGIDEGTAVELARHIALEDPSQLASAALRVGAEIERAGALNLAASWLGLVERAFPNRSPLDIGRTKAQRASVARKLGALEAARELYMAVDQLGKTTGEPELTARAWIGYAILAHMRGNYPDARQWYNAAAMIAEDNRFSEQLFAARQGLMIAAAVARDFDEAMREGWKAFLASENDHDREAEVLTNMAQALHESGWHDAALRGFAAAVARTNLTTVLLPALGGAAAAAAASRRREVVEAAADRIALLAGSAWDYPIASALLDLADAYDVLGNARMAADYRTRGLSIARAGGFHELAQRTEKPGTRDARTSSPLPFSSAATRVVNDIESLNAAADLIGVA